MTLSTGLWEPAPPMAAGSAGMAMPPMPMPPIPTPMPTPIPPPCSALTACRAAWARYGKKKGKPLSKNGETYAVINDSDSLITLSIQQWLRERKHLPLGWGSCLSWAPCGSSIACKWGGFWWRGWQRSSSSPSSVHTPRCSFPRMPAGEEQRNFFNMFFPSLNINTI